MRIDTHKKIESATVGTYKGVENYVVDAYKAIETAFVDRFLESVVAVANAYLILEAITQEQHNLCSDTDIKTFFTILRLKYLLSILILLYDI